jgi:hypothetical protein
MSHNSLNLATTPEILASLDAGERKIFEILHQVLAQRAAKNEAPPNLAIITDPPKDTDDPMLLMALAMLHRLGLVK